MFDGQKMLLIDHILIERKTIDRIMNVLIEEYNYESKNKEHYPEINATRSLVFLKAEKIRAIKDRNSLFMVLLRANENKGLDLSQGGDLGSKLCK